MAFHSVMNYLVKVGKSIPIHSTFAKIDDFACAYVDDVFGAVSSDVVKTLKKSNIKLTPSKEVQAKLGDASLWMESRLAGALPEARAELQLMFGDLSSVETMLHRSKDALSILPKLEKGLIKAAEETCGFTSFDDVINVIGDGIGSRIITKALPRLSNAELDDLIKKTIVDGRPIKPEEIRKLKIYLKSSHTGKFSKDVFHLYEEFTKPLVEKRSGEVVDCLTASILKHRVLNEGLDLNELRKKGLFKDEILDLVESGNVLPLEILELNNYRGLHGLSEFTNGQIQQLSIAMNSGRSGKYLKIFSDVRGLDSRIYPAEDLAEAAKKSVKASGYRTAQMNIRHANGTLGEIQIRGPQTNIFGEYEHIAYDLRQGKNTLGPLFDDFAKAVSSLSEPKYAKYNEYLEECYNYYNRIELGLPAVKPRLPKGLPKVLSEDSMKALHDTADQIAKIESKNFYRHFSAVA